MIALFKTAFVQYVAVAITVNLWITYKTRVYKDYDTLDISPYLCYDLYMKLNCGTMTGNYALGVYIHNWGHPIKNDWEIGFQFFKWYVGLSLNA
jgi:hypothetical protein